MKRKSKKVTVSRETLRRLDAPELAAVAGGLTTFKWCYPPSFPVVSCYCPEEPPIEG